jgi:hypothetical protein
MVPYAWRQGRLKEDRRTLGIGSFQQSLEGVRNLKRDLGDVRPILNLASFWMSHTARLGTPFNPGIEDPLPQLSWSLRADGDATNMVYTEA